MRFLFFILTVFLFHGKLNGKTQPLIIKLNLYERCVQDDIKPCTLAGWKAVDLDFEMNLSQKKISMYDKEFRVTERYRIDRANMEQTNSKNGIYAYNCFDYTRRKDIVFIIQLPNQSSSEVPQIKIIYKQSGIPRVYFYKIRLPED